MAFNGTRLCYTVSKIKLAINTVILTLKTSRRDGGLHLRWPMLPLKLPANLTSKNADH